MFRSIAFINVPSFPFTVERAVSRRLRGRPLILARSAHPRSRCLSVSQEAQGHGIRRGMSIADARRRCRDVETLHPDPPLYQRASSALLRIVGEYSPLIEPLGFGRGFIDLTGTERLFGDADAVVGLLRQRLIRELRLPAEAGIAVNKLVSRVAAFDAAPEGLLLVERGGEEPFLEPHRVSVLPAADRDVRTKLTELNITVVQQIKEIELDLLLYALGPAAFSLSRQARGIDPEPVIPPSAPPRIALTEELSEDTNNRDQITGLVKRMVIEGSFRLHRQGKSAGEAIMNILYSDGQTERGSIRSRGATASTAVWIGKTRELLAGLIKRRVRIRRVELTFSRLTAASRQLGLWESGSKTGQEAVSPEKSCRLDRVMGAMERIQSRFGARALSFGVAA